MYKYFTKKTFLGGLLIAFYLIGIPSNDLNAQGSTCADATDLGVLSGCALSGTGDGPTDGTAEATCFGADAVGADWYTFTAPAADVLITVTSTNDLDEPDTRLSIQDACAGACVASDDDGGAGFTSLATFTADCNTSYWIQWDDRWSTVDYDWDITVDACAAPIAADVVVGPGLDDGAGGSGHMITVPAAASGTGIPCGGVLEIEYGPAPLTPGTGTIAPLMPGGMSGITGLDVCTTYEYIIRNSCDPFGDGCVPATESTDVGSFTTICPCTDPTFTVADGSDCGMPVLEVEITPDPAMPDLDDYDIEIGLPGFTPGTGAEIAAVNTTAAANPTIIGTLDCDTAYEVYVQHNCTAGEGIWVGPETITLTDCAGACCATFVPVALTEYCATTIAEPGTFIDGASNNCFGSGATEASWYTFTPAADGVITVEAISNTDTRLSIYDGACDMLNCLDFDDDDSPIGFGSLIEDLPVACGTEYLIEWDDRWSDTGFDWTLDFDCPAATGLAATGDISGEIEVTYAAPGGCGEDLQIIVVPCGTDVATGTAVPATGSPQVVAGLTDCTCYDVYIINDCLGLGIDADCENVTTTVNTFCPCSEPTLALEEIASCDDPGIAVTITPDAAMPDTDDYSIEIGLVGFAPGTGAEVASAPNVMAAASPIDITGLDCGVEYEVYVQHNCMTGTSPWIAAPASITLVMCSGCACPEEIVPGTCAAPTTTTVAPFAGVLSASNVCNTGATDAVWYSMTAPMDGNICINSAIDADLPDTRVSVYTGACDALSCEVTDDDSGAGFTSATILPAVAGTDYLIEWDDRWNDGEFDFEVKYLEQTDATAEMTLDGAALPDEVCADVGDLEIGIPMAMCPAGSGAVIFVDAATDGTYETIVAADSVTITPGAPGEMMTICVECQCACGDVVLLPDPTTDCHVILFTDPAVDPNCLTLPVQLGDFTGKVAASANVLTWTTLSELNTEFFQLEKSSDGQRWQELGRVEAVGNSNTLEAYEYVHSNPGKVEYYRLRVVDFDGYEELSNVIRLERSAYDQRSLNIYPNPVNNVLYYDYISPNSESVAIQVTDVNGKLISTAKLDAVIGLNQSYFDVTDLTNGVYFIHIQGQTDMVVKRFFKQD